MYIGTVVLLLLLYRGDYYLVLCWLCVRKRVCVGIAVLCVFDKVVLSHLGRNKNGDRESVCGCCVREGLRCVCCVSPIVY